MSSTFQRFPPVLIVMKENNFPPVLIDHLSCLALTYFLCCINYSDNLMFMLNVKPTN